MPVKNIGKPRVQQIDVDIVDSDRPKIFEYIIQRFTKEKTARVASYGTAMDLGTIDDIGRALKIIYEIEHGKDCENPWDIPHIKQIKKAYSFSEETARKTYPELFYFFDGITGTKISQSVHPAGMVISPITLADNYGVFFKDGINCLMVDMEEAHELGLAKYDFLILKNIQIISDTCKLIGIPYPKTHEMNWNDEKVWEDMLRSPVGIFQMEGCYAHECLRKFKPHSIFDMSLVTASIRPSGASYRNDLLAKKPNHNPSKLIDDLLSDNNGYLVYQEDVIKFLQIVCGLSGSDADNVRRAIGRKDEERLQQALPNILEGYCQKSDKPREQAEQEAKEFLRIIEDASSYMFG